MRSANESRSRRRCGRLRRGRARCWTPRPTGGARRLCGPRVGCTGLASGAAAGAQGVEGCVDAAGEDAGELELGLPADDSLSAFLERVSLVADADSLPESGDGVVTLMTLHTAKGLEFPVVFCSGWEDGVFPHMRALGEPAELAEERRLAYVGITRARQRLYLSRALMRSAWGQPMTNPASRFFTEIPEELLAWRRVGAQPSAP